MEYHLEWTERLIEQRKRTVADLKQAKKRKENVKKVREAKAKEYMELLEAAINDLNGTPLTLALTVGFDAEPGTEFKVEGKKVEALIRKAEVARMILWPDADEIQLH